MGKKIKTLHVVSSMNRGGLETLIMTWYRAIDRDKFQFDVAVHTQKEAAYDAEFQDLGGTIYRFPKFNGFNILKYIESWRNFFSDHGDYTIIHAHLISMAFIFFNMAGKVGIIRIAHSHNTIPRNFSLKYSIYRIFLFPLRYCADFYFGCSKQAAIDAFGRRIVSNKNKCMTVNNTIRVNSFPYDPELRQKYRDEMQIRDNFVLGTVGSITKQKNPDKLIDIFRCVREMDKNTKLLWVGTGKLEMQIKKKAERLGLINDIIFTGSRDDVPTLMSAMDVFVLPSLWEGFGIVLIEAQSTGLHCIVSDKIQPEACVVKEQVHALSVKAASTIWAHEILQYKTYKRTDKRDEVAKSGFDENECVQKIQDFYVSISS